MAITAQAILNELDIPEGTENQQALEKTISAIDKEILSTSWRKWDSVCQFNIQKNEDYRNWMYPHINKTFSNKGWYVNVIAVHPGRYGTYICLRPKTRVLKQVLSLIAFIVFIVLFLVMINN